MSERGAWAPRFIAASRCAAAATRGASIVAHFTAVLLGATLSACNTNETLTEPRDDGGGGGGGGTVQRASLTIELLASNEDSAVLRVFGWNQRPPGVIVEITRDDGSGRRLDTAGADGVVTFDSLLEGRYRISASRSLTGAESSQLPSPLQDVTGFGGGANVLVAAPSHRETVTLMAGQRGSLVISEFHNGWWEVPPVGTYYFGAYIELYNNSDTTINLDGKHLIQGYSYDLDSPLEPCDRNAPFRLDSTGVWAGVVYRFPGTGKTYALAPGETVVIATDAIDHRPFAARGLDLSAAEFEMIGPADVDNPSSINLTNLGPNEWVRGHGALWTTSAVPMVADSFDYAALDYATTSHFNTPYVRIPAAKIIDVAAFVYDRAVATQFEKCERIIHPRFDAAEADLLLYDDLASIHRKVLFRTSDGRAVLQRTRTSARDFVKGERSPGALP